MVNLTVRGEGPAAVGRRCIPPGAAFGFFLSGVEYSRNAPSSRRARRPRLCAAGPRCVTVLNLWPGPLRRDEGPSSRAAEV